MINWIKNTRRNRKKYIGKDVYFYQSNGNNVSNIFKSTIGKWSEKENHDSFLCFIEGIYSPIEIDVLMSAKQIFHKTCSHFCHASEYEAILPKEGEE